MSIRAKNLLHIHKHLLSRESVLVAHVASLQEWLDDDGAEDIISSMSLGRKPIGTPTSGRRMGSSTEHIALHYQEALQSQSGEIRAAIAEVLHELRQVRFSLSLYSAVMKSLNEAEARFVLLYYDECISMNRIAEVNLLTGTQSMYSVSTLRRLNAAILNKIDAALGPERAQKPALYTG